MSVKTAELPLGAVLAEFPASKSKAERYAPLFDGKCYKVDPEAYDYDRSDAGSARFASAVSQAARKFNCYARTMVTFDNHVMVQERPDGYVPKHVGGRPPKGEQK